MTLHRLTALVLFSISLLLVACDAIPDLPGMAELTNVKDELYPNNTLPKNDVVLSTKASWIQETSATPFTARSGNTGLLPVMNDNYWVVGVDDATGTQAEVWSSADGITWTKVTITGGIFSARKDATLTSLNNELYLIGGRNGSTCFDEVWKTTDGADWTKLDAGSRFSARWGHQVVAFKKALGTEALYLMGGSDFGGNTDHQVWTSEDGVTWTYIESGLGFGDRSAFGAVVFNNALWIAGGIDDDGNPSNAVWTSADGASWENTSDLAYFSARSFPTFVTDDNQLILLFGQGKTSELDDGWVSGNGVTWKSLTLPGAPTARHGMGAIVAAPTIYLVGGVADSTNTDEVWAGTLQ